MKHNNSGLKKKKIMMEHMLFSLSKDITKHDFFFFCGWFLKIFIYLFIYIYIKKGEGGWFELPTALKWLLIASKSNERVHVHEHAILKYMYMSCFEIHIVWFLRDFRLLSRSHGNNLRSFLFFKIAECPVYQGPSSKGLFYLLI